MTTSTTQNDIEKIKIAILGSCGVGKTCITTRYIKNEYNKDTKTTDGANYQQKIFTRGNKTVQLDLWDTAGQEKYRSIGKHFYKDAYIIILVYDITREKTFSDIKEIWYDDVKKNGEKYTVIALVGNKSDLYEEEENVKESMARAYAKEIGATFMLVSAQNGSNINNLFNTVVNLYFGDDFQPKVQEMVKEKQVRSGSIKLKNNIKTHKEKNCNC